MTTEEDAVESTVATPKTGYSADYVRELREEAKSVRLKAAEYRAQLEEQAKLNAETSARIAEMESKLSNAEQVARGEIALAKVEALAAKAGIVDLDALALLDRSQFKYDEAGKITNAAEVLEAFKTAKPHFFGSTNTSQTEKAPPAAETQKKTAKDMDAKEWAAFQKKHNLI